MHGKEKPSKMWRRFKVRKNVNEKVVRVRCAGVLILRSCTLVRSLICFRRFDVSIREYDYLIDAENCKSSCNVAGQGRLKLRRLSTRAVSRYMRYGNEELLGDNAPRNGDAHCPISSFE